MLVGDYLFLRARCQWKEVKFNEELNDEIHLRFNFFLSNIMKLIQLLKGKSGSLYSCFIYPPQILKIVIKGLKGVDECEKYISSLSGCKREVVW